MTWVKSKLFAVFVFKEMEMNIQYFSGCGIMKLHFEI